MSLELILGAIFGGGFATLIATVGKLVADRRKGKIESEDSVISRLESENRKARERADEAEMESEDYRRRMHRAEDRAALLQRLLKVNGIAIPAEETGDVH